MSAAPALFAGPCDPATVADFLRANHYLGACGGSLAWSDEFGVMVFSRPVARRLPQDWLELRRWCLVRGHDNGSRQWSRVAAWLRGNTKHATVVSYSDPSVGHTGALYRACNWWWAPTWHRLRPPPSGNGRWSTDTESVKDRWVFALGDDPRRADALAVQDDAVLARLPFMHWHEPPDPTAWKRVFGRVAARTSTEPTEGE